MSTLRLIMGDQLSRTISSLDDVDKEMDTILFCEVHQEATHIKHHKKKIAFLFSAMRHFSDELTKSGFKVCYVKYDNPDNTGSFFSEVKRHLVHLGSRSLVVTQPSEWRVYSDVKQWQKKLNVPVEIREDSRFLSSIDEFATWANGRKQCRMEFFYREMRRKHDILMDGDQPIGGQWNFDADNRKSPPQEMKIPEPYSARPDATTSEVIKLVDETFSEHFGDIEPFYFAVTRRQALNALKRFIRDRLPLFGDYQDAMIQNEPWMYHSHISFYLNCGLLHPMECVRAAEEAYHDGAAPLNAVEGFVRQIIGWREYVRGIYWLKMPEYKKLNFLSADRDLPSFYWTAQTSMNCLKQCVTETRQNAYAHHIQRLMVLGNFALIAGLHPNQVNEWFHIVYADAYEWVELPNVSGMTLFADGGFLASKPYASGGAYINKMSNYCKGCQYKVSKKNGSDACPFNYLYWDFLVRNRDHLSSNPRIAMMYRTYDRMSEEKKQAIEKDSLDFLERLS